MSDLPDIDTAKVSFLAYWNAIDSGGVSDIDPTEVTSNSSVDSYTLYDNGLEGVYSLLSGRDASFRVKEDGWLVVYIDQEENYGTNVDTPLTGPWDILNNYRRAEGVSHFDTPNPQATDLVQNQLERAISSLQAEFSNSGSITYNTSDVGLYNYLIETATTATNLTDGGEVSSTVEFGFTYTSDTDIKWAAATAMGTTNGGDGDLMFEGDKLVDVTGEYPDWAVIDPQKNSLIPNSGTEYGHTVERNDNGIEYSINFLAIWA